MGSDNGWPNRPRYLVRLAEQGRLKVVMAATYPLSEAAAAHRALATGHTRGKIALVP
jgi:NADPH:quinone reductase-like Zn-dependent oxidoreductase